MPGAQALRDEAAVFSGRPGDLARARPVAVFPATHCTTLCNGDAGQGLGQHCHRRPDGGRLIHNRFWCVAVASCQPDIQAPPRRHAGGDLCIARSRSTGIGDAGRHRRVCQRLCPLFRDPRSKRDACKQHPAPLRGGSAKVYHAVTPIPRPATRGRDRAGHGRSIGRHILYIRCLGRRRHLSAGGNDPELGVGQTTGRRSQ